MGLKLQETFYMLPDDVMEADFLHGRPATTFEAKLYLASRARRKSGPVNIDGSFKDIPKGGIFDSQVKLAKKLHWDRKKLWRFLRELERADRLTFHPSFRPSSRPLGSYTGYTLIILKDIWGLKDGEKWSNDEPIPQAVPHIRYGRDVSSLRECNSKYGISGSSNGSVDGVLSSERAVELEPALIGALLLEPEVIAEVAAILKPADFSAPACLKTYECILALHIDGEAVDHLTVDAALRKAKFPEPTAADLTDWTADALPSHTVIAQAKKIACAKVKSS